MTNLTSQDLITWAKTHKVFICEAALAWLPSQNNLETAYNNANLQFKLWVINQIIRPREGEFEPFFKALLAYSDTDMMDKIISLLVDLSRHPWDFVRYTRWFDEKELNNIIQEHFPWTVMEEFFLVRLAEPIPNPEPVEEDYYD